MNVEGRAREQRRQLKQEAKRLRKEERRQAKAARARAKTQPAATSAAIRDLDGKEFGDGRIRVEPAVPLRV